MDPVDETRNAASNPPNRRQFVASLLAMSVQPALGSPAAGARRSLPPSLLRHDLDELWNTLLAVGVYPFHTSDRAAVAERYRTIRAALTAPLDPLSFVLVVAPIFGALNDGHVGIGPDAGYAGALAVPVRCTPAGRDLIVLASAGDAIEPGSTLLSLGGVPAERIRDVTLAGWGGQTVRMRIERFAAGSRIVSSILANDPARYHVRWRTPSGALRDATLPRAVVPMPWARGGDASYSFRAVAGGSIGLIDYRRCVDLPSFRVFLRETFSAIQSARMRAVIVDIRTNGGGDSDLNDELWGYLTAKTFTQFGPIVMRSSDYLKQRYGRAKYVEIYGPEAWDAVDGTLITYSQSKIGFVHPAPNTLRFNGPVALLIGPRTFSSALDCAIAAKDYGLATLIGEETSQPVETTGEVITIATRFSGVTGSFTTKYFVPPKPSPAGRGVIPEIEVRTTLDDVIARRDPVLARAIQELRT